MILPPTRLGEWSMGPYLTFQRADFSYKAYFWKKSIFCDLYSSNPSKVSKIALKNAWKKSKKSQKKFSVKWLVMHPRWSRVVPNHFPDTKECFSTTLHPQNEFLNFFQKSKFRPQNRFFMLHTALHAKKCDFELISKSNLFLKFWSYLQRI